MFLYLVLCAQRESAARIKLNKETKNFSPCACNLSLTRMLWPGNEPERECLGQASRKRFGYYPQNYFKDNAITTQILKHPKSCTKPESRVLMHSKDLFFEMIIAFVLLFYETQPFFRKISGPCQLKSIFV